MTSDPQAYTEAFVWIWLPGEGAPVVAGRLHADRDALLFNYGRSYLARDTAISLYHPELPLRAGALPLLDTLSMPNCIRDASPDAWGRRVIINRKLQRGGVATADGQLDELTYLLEFGSDRVGALDFQLSATEYEPRSPSDATLDELHEAATLVDEGAVLSPDLDQALRHGTSIGGARPKALITDDDKKYIAKFSSSGDLYSVVKAEFTAMRLAALVGLNVAPVALTKSANKDVLLIERFDRVRGPGDWHRRAMVSALTLLALDEMMARYASYQDLAEIVRHRFTGARETLSELFGRIAFNILCGNTDDHARNHAAFWDGEALSLTPAYDICPQSRTGNEASQAMLISGDNRFSRLSACLEAAHHFLLTEKEARAIVERQIIGIGDHWATVCNDAALSDVDRALLWGRQFLNPFAFADLDAEHRALRALADQVHGANAA